MAQAERDGSRSAEKREMAITRLMTIINVPHCPTAEERRNQAEWIVDAILDAAMERAGDDA